jgi:hypothetical protein
VTAVVRHGDTLKKYVYLSDDAWEDLEFCMRIGGHHTRSQAFAAMIRRERGALDGTWRQTLDERRARDRRKQALAMSTPTL